MGVTMAQGITMGAPLFGTPGDFITAMKGQGTIGPLLTLMGVKPVKFLSESDFAKSISTESKVFSISSVGIVKGYKRETRVKVTAVVDFRPAPSLLGGAGPAPTSTAQSSVSSQSIAAALQPSVGGQVLYYNIE
jgi:general secretion pathway protein K